MKFTYSHSPATSRTTYFCSCGQEFELWRLLQKHIEKENTFALSSLFGTVLKKEVTDTDFDKEFIHLASHSVKVTNYRLERKMTLPDPKLLNPKKPNRPAKKPDLTQEIYKMFKPGG